MPGFRVLFPSGEFYSYEPADGIMADNEAMLRERLSRTGFTIPLVRLPHYAVLDQKNWAEIGRALEPLAARLTLPADNGKTDEIIRRDHAALWHPYSSPLERPPLEAVQYASGNRIRLMDGRWLIDGMSSWWACIHGYNHPALVAAIQKQAAVLSHVMFGGLTHAPAVDLAERLKAVLPAGLERIFFADSGSVAVEVAMKMALQYQTGQGKAEKNCFLAPMGGYHGDTFGAMSVCDPVTGMHTMFNGNLGRRFLMDRPACRLDQPFSESSLDSARQIFQEHGDEIAAVILEPVVQGAGGMWFYHPGYLRGLARLCQENGCLLIFDEIATGFGRTGKYFAAEWAGIAPDILCCGKALTGGMLTLAACACSRAVVEGIQASGAPLMHGPTFMANPLACSVANASLDLLAQGRWRDQVATLEAALKQALSPCAGLTGVADTRVLGAIGVVEMDSSVNTRNLQKYLVGKGVWIRPFGRLIYLMPPYVTPPEDVETLGQAIFGAIEEGAWKS